MAPLLNFLALLALLCHGAEAMSVGSRPGVRAARERATSVAPPRSRIALSSMSSQSPESKWYRTLGVGADASYDDVSEAFADLVKAAGSDEARIKTLERARDMILDSRLKMRLSGQGAKVVDPTIKVKAKVDWLGPLRVIAKYTERPSLKILTKNSAIFLTFAILSLVSPNLGDQMAFFSIICGPAFIYNRGMPEPVRDDMGQIGEILPTKSGPMALAALISWSFALTGYLFAVFYLSLLVPPRVAPAQALCNSMVALFTWFATVFFKTQIDR